METHSSIHAWKIPMGILSLSPWTVKHGGLQPMGSQTVQLVNWTTKHSTASQWKLCDFILSQIKWNKKWSFIIHITVYLSAITCPSLLLLLLLLSCFSRVRLCATSEMAAHQASPSLGFSRQAHWRGLPFLSPMHESEKWKWSRSVVSNPQGPHGLQPTRLLSP